MITSLMMKCNTMFQRIASSISAASEEDHDVADVSRSQQAGLLVRKKTLWKQVVLPKGIKQSAFREDLQAPRLQEPIFRERLIALDTVSMPTCFPSCLMPVTGGDSICTFTSPRAREWRRRKGPKM